MKVSLSRENVLTTTRIEDQFADLRQFFESTVLGREASHEVRDRLDTVLEMLASNYPTFAESLSRARSQAVRLPDTDPVLIGMALVLTTLDLERETAVNVTAETRAEVADETRAAALTALATVLAARATALSGADEEIEEMAEARTKTPDEARADKTTADALWSRLRRRRKVHLRTMLAFSCIRLEEWGS